MIDVLTKLEQLKKRKEQLERGIVEAEVVLKNNKEKKEELLATCKSLGIVAIGNIEEAIQTRIAELNEEVAAKLEQAQVIEKEVEDIIPKEAWDGF